MCTVPEIERESERGGFKMHPLHYPVCVLCCAHFFPSKISVNIEGVKADGGPERTRKKEKSAD